MPVMSTKYRPQQAVLVLVGDEWKLGKVYKCFPKRLYQIHMDEGGYKTVTEDKVKAPE